MLLASLPLHAFGVVTAVYLNIVAPSPEDVRVRGVDVATAPLATDPATDVPSVLDEPVTVNLFDVNHEESATVVIHRDGTVDDSNDKQISRLFRCKRTGKQRSMDKGLLRLIADLQLRYPGRTINFVSGYRGHREESKTSPHRAGRALDLRINGVRPTEIRDYLWKSHHEVGVGWYPHEGFVHIDARDKDLAWTETKGQNHYHPSWADRARRDRSKDSIGSHRAKRTKRPNA
jgi:uncharacterized protein YcbK (DUF882 family)